MRISFGTFMQCHIFDETCGQKYWKGSNLRLLIKILKLLWKQLVSKVEFWIFLGYYLCITKDEWLQNTKTKSVFRVYAFTFIPFINTKTSYQCQSCYNRSNNNRFTYLPTYSKLPNKHAARLLSFQNFSYHHAHIWKYIKTPIRSLFFMIFVPPTRLCWLHAYLAA